MMVSDTVAVTVNGRNRRFPAGLTVYALLQDLELNPALVVVERNREILDRAAYPAVPVQEGDVFELVHFVGGG